LRQRPGDLVTEVQGLEEHEDHQQAHHHALHQQVAQLPEQSRHRTAQLLHIQQFGEPVGVDGQPHPRQAIQHAQVVVVELLLDAGQGLDEGAEAVDQQQAEQRQQPADHHQGEPDRQAQAQSQAIEPLYRGSADHSDEDRQQQWHQQARAGLHARHDYHQRRQCQRQVEGDDARGIIVGQRHRENPCVPVRPPSCPLAASATITRTGASAD
jgi:hypothetical protein